jgi:hypothetical protein
MKKPLESVKHTTQNVHGLDNYLIQDINALIFSRLAQEYLEDNDNFIIKYDDREEEQINMKRLDAQNDVTMEHPKLITIACPESDASPTSQNLSHGKEKEGRVFKCPVGSCMKQYKSRENLNLHIKNIHEEIKPYTCRFCPHTFSHRNGKTYHERKFHINYLPYGCLYEGKKIILKNINFNF